MGVPDTDQLLRGHQYQGISPLQVLHGGAEGILDGGRCQTLPGDNVGNGLRVAGGVENRPRQFQFAAELGGVAEITVVGEGHAPFLMVDLNGLAVAPVGGPGGAIAGVAHRHGPLRKPLQNIPAKHLAHQPKILVGRKDTIVVDHNAAALLPPVLECVEAIVDHPSHIGRLRLDDTEHAAFFMDCHTIYLILK